MFSRLVVLDTNVVVSAALKEDSNPARILSQVLLGKISVLLCPSIHSEYQLVFSRPKFRVFHFPPIWFKEFLANCIYINKDPAAWPRSGPDKDDLVFLSLAAEQNACLVTGNLADFPETLRMGTEVVSPAQYVAWLGQG